MASNMSLAITVGAALSAAFTGTFNEAGSTLDKLKNKISGLSEEQKKYEKIFSERQVKSDNYAALQKSVEETTSKISEAQSVINNALISTGKPYDDIKSKVDAARETVANLTGKLTEQESQLKKLGEELQSTAKDTEGFTQEQAKLAEKTEKLQKIQADLEQAQSRATATRQNIMLAKADFDASLQFFNWIKAPIAVGAEFEQAMAKVKAVSGATGEEFKALSEQARQLGRDTQYTAVQAAESQENLARAGFTTEEILQAMPGLLSMAAAEGMNLAAAADIAGNALRGFQMPADQMDRVADVLAKTSAATSTSIEVFGAGVELAVPDIGAPVVRKLSEAAAVEIPGALRFNKRIRGIMIWKKPVGERAGFG